MKLFDPRLFPQPAQDLTPVPVHGIAWRDKARHWWAGANIASPTTETVVPAKQSITAVRRFLEDVDALNGYYTDETEYARYLIRQALALANDVPVILDASGTSAIVTATRMFAHVGRHPEFRGFAGGLPAVVGKFFVVSLTEDGSTPAYAFDPEAQHKYFPVTKLFFEPQPLTYPQGMKVAHKGIDLNGCDNLSLLEKIRSAVEELSAGATTCGCIVLPTVSKLGRILPVREVAALVADLRNEGHNLFLLVDDVQGMGRLDQDSTRNPVSYCDAYVFSSSKALGGLITASACVMREDLISVFAEKANRAEALTGTIAHFQFEPRFQTLFDDRLLKNGAVSIPEIVAMSAAFRYFLERGEGATLQAKRLDQLAKVERERARVVGAISAIPGVKVLESEPGRPLVPSIVSFTIGDQVSPAEVRRVLQQGAPVVTLARAVGPYLRLDIPEYRPVPPAEVLAEKLARVLAQLKS